MNSYIPEKGTNADFEITIDVKQTISGKGGTFSSLEKIFRGKI